MVADEFRQIMIGCNNYFFNPSVYSFIHLFVRSSTTYGYSSANASTGTATCPNLSPRERTPEDTLVSPPYRMPILHATVHVITRCRRGPANILITAQYINYWPYNLAGTRRGISPRSVFVSAVLRPSVHIYTVVLRLAIPLPLLFSFSVFFSLAHSLRGPFFYLPLSTFYGDLHFLS